MKRLDKLPCINGLYNEAKATAQVSLLVRLYDNRDPTLLVEILHVSESAKKTFSFASQWVWVFLVQEEKNLANDSLVLDASS